MISRKTRIVLSGALLMIAGVIVISMLLANRPSFIQINDGTFKIIELPYTYTRNDVYVLVVSSAIGGMMLSYLITILFTTGRSEAKNKIAVEEPEEIRASGTAVPTNINSVKDDPRLVDAVLTALEGDEKELVKQIADNRGEMLQNEIVLSLKFSKAKVSRMLKDLEKRGLLVKKHYGLTNKIVLADKLRGGKIEK